MDEKFTQRIGDLENKINETFESFRIEKEALGYKENGDKFSKEELSDLLEAMPMEEDIEKSKADLKFNYNLNLEIAEDKIFELETKVEEFYDMVKLVENDMEDKMNSVCLKFGLKCDEIPDFVEILNDKINSLKKEQENADSPIDKAKIGRQIGELESEITWFSENQKVFDNILEEAETANIELRNQKEKLIINSKRAKECLGKNGIEVRDAEFKKVEKEKIKENEIKEAKVEESKVKEQEEQKEKEEQKSEEKNVEKNKEKEAEKTPNSQTTAQAGNTVKSGEAQEVNELEETPKEQTLPVRQLTRKEKKQEYKEKIKSVTEAINTVKTITSLEKEKVKPEEFVKLTEAIKNLEDNKDMLDKKILKNSGENSFKPGGTSFFSKMINHRPEDILNKYLKKATKLINIDINNPSRILECEAKITNIDNQQTVIKDVLIRNSLQRINCLVDKKASQIDKIEIIFAEHLTKYYNEYINRETTCKSFKGYLEEEAKQIQQLEEKNKSKDFKQESPTIEEIAKQTAMREEESRKKEEMGKYSPEDTAHDYLD